MSYRAVRPIGRWEGSFTVERRVLPDLLDCQEGYARHTTCLRHRVARLLCWGNRLASWGISKGETRWDVAAEVSAARRGWRAASPCHEGTWRSPGRRSRSCLRVPSAYGR